MSQTTIDSQQKPKVGDKVCRTSLVAENQEVSYYRIRKVDLNANSFETDPNGPFERAWKGRISDFKPHHLHPGYWVAKPQGAQARATLQKIREKSQAVANTKPETVQSRFSVDLNWHGETMNIRVKAASQDQAMVVASLRWSQERLSTYTSAAIYAYMKNNETRVSVKQVN